MIERRTPGQGKEVAQNTQPQRNNNYLLRNRNSAANRNGRDYREAESTRINSDQPINSNQKSTEYINQQDKVKSVINHEGLANDSQQTYHAKPKQSQSNVSNFSLKSKSSERWLHVQDLCKSVSDGGWIQNTQDHLQELLDQGAGGAQQEGLGYTIYRQFDSGPLGARRRGPRS